MPPIPLVPPAPPSPPARGPGGRHRKGNLSPDWAGAPPAPVPRADPVQAALLAAVLDRDLPAVLAALARGASPIDTIEASDLRPEDPYLVPGGSLVHFAVEQRAFALAEALLNAGAAVSPIDRLGRTPLHAAAQWGAHAMVTTLLGAGADPLARDRADRTPLHLMACAARTEVPSEDLVQCATRLIAAAPACVAVADRDGFTPLHFAAARQDRALTRLLIAQGAPVRAQSGTHLTPLHGAVRVLGSPDHVRAALVRQLLAAGASPHAVDRLGTTPVTDAARQQMIETVRALLDGGGTFAPDVLRLGLADGRQKIRRTIDTLLRQVARGRPLPAAALASILAIDDRPIREAALLAIGRSAPAPAPAPAASSGAPGQATTPGSRVR